MFARAEVVAGSGVSGREDMENGRGPDVEAGAARSSFQGRAGGAMTLANVFTIARLIMIPIFGFLWLRGDAEQALWVFVIAGATDVLDGLIARCFNQCSRLGAILDPAADKLLLVVSYLGAALTHAVPFWLVSIVIGRDVMVAIGAGLFAWVLKGRLDPDEWCPSRIGKYTMFVQSLVVALALFEGAFRPLWVRSWLPAIMCVAATLTLASGLQFVQMLAGALRRAPGEKGARLVAGGESRGAA
jgi:cardiolipin synthase